MLGNKWYSRRIALASWLLAAVFVIQAGTVQGQAVPHGDAHDAAIKTVLELGGKLRYADEFMSRETLLTRYPLRDPLDEYANMKCFDLAASSSEGRPDARADGTRQRIVVQVDLSGTRPTDAEVARLAAFPQLRVLLLNSTLLPDESLRHVGQLRQLEALDLSSTRVTGAGLRPLASLTRLKELHLIETQVDDEGMRWLQGMADLERLDLCRSHVGDQGLELLAQSNRLRRLWIGNTATTQEAVNRFWQAHRQCEISHDHWTKPVEQSPKESDRRTGDPFGDEPPIVPGFAPPPAPPLPPIRRDHPTVSRVLTWDGRVVAQCSVPVPSEPNEPQQRNVKRRFFVIDAVAARSAPLSLPNVDEILHLATIGRSEPVVIGLRNGTRSLFCKEEGAWVVHPLPGEAQQSSLLAIVADSRDLVVLTPDEYFWWKNGNWAVRRHSGGDKYLARPNLCSLSYAIADGSLYRAVDRGEFGGGLYRLELSTGKWSPAKPGLTDMPVCDVQVDPQGRLWVVAGISHMGLIKGDVWVRVGEQWRDVISIDGFYHRKIGWNLGHTDPQAIAFDTKGRVHLVSSDYGICREEGRCWKPLIRPWPGDGRACLHFAGPDLAVVGTDRSGVFVCRLGTGTAQQVLLVPPDPSQ